MPELPEVETIKNVIEPQIQGLTIKKATVNRPEVIAYPTADDFCSMVAGQVISFMKRRGKFLMLHLENNSRIILHLRMTGCLLIAPPEFPLVKHTHILMELSNGRDKAPLLLKSSFQTIWIPYVVYLDSTLHYESYTPRFTLLKDNSSGNCHKWHIPHSSYI